MTAERSLRKTLSRDLRLDLSYDYVVTRGKHILQTMGLMFCGPTSGRTGNKDVFSYPGKVLRRCFEAPYVYPSAWATLCRRFCC